MILNMKIYHSTATYGLYSQDTALFKGLAMLSPTYVTAAITTAFLYDHTCLLWNLARIWNQTQSLCVIKIFYLASADFTILLTEVAIMWLTGSTEKI